MNRTLDIGFPIAISDTLALRKAKAVPISVTDLSYILRFIGYNWGSCMTEDHSFDRHMFDLTLRYMVYMQEYSIWK